MGYVDDVELFDADYFRVPPAEAAALDPQHRVLLELAVAAIEDAGYGEVEDATVGVFVGCGENHYDREHVRCDAKLVQQLGEVRVTLGGERDFLAPRIAFKLGFKGPAVTVQASCATSLTAVAMASTALVAGDCDLALAGGVSLLLPDVDGYVRQEGGILSADGRCRAFDAAATGAVPASGAGLVVLKRDRDAQADRDRRLAVLRGWAVGSDGASRAGFAAPSVDGQEAVIRKAHARAGVQPSDVGYVEAHGTGTPIGDPVEVAALGRVFADGSGDPRTCALGSVKTNLGHTDAASGIAGLLKAVLAVQHGVVPPTLHFRKLNPEIDFEGTPFFVNSTAVPWSAGGMGRVAGVSSFGLGGTNAHVVLELAEPHVPAEATRPTQVIVLSARDPQALDRLREGLAGWLDDRGPVSPAELADIAYTLARGRRAFAYRWAGAFATGPDLVAALRFGHAAGQPVTRRSLSVHGTASELSASTEAIGDPLVGAELERLGDAAPLSGTLVALACARALQRLGLVFARATTPAWMEPIGPWLDCRQPLAGLAEALASCAPAHETDRLGGEPAGAVVIDDRFDLAREVARAWASGADVDWRAYYGGEERGRVALPSYPFARRRFWIERVVEPLTSTAIAGPAALGAFDVASVVASVWRDVLGVEEVAHDEHFVDDLDGDSIFAVEIGAQLSEHFGVELPVDLPFLAPTVTEAAAYVEEALAAGVAR